MTAAGKYQLRETGELFEVTILDEGEARPSPGFDRQGNFKGVEFETHIARNRFHTWTGCRRNFEDLFEKI